MPVPPPRVLAGAAGAYGLTWLLVSAAILAASAAARVRRPAGRLPGVRNVVRVDARLWRGAAPTPEGYRALAARGVRTVVDLRAERLPGETWERPARAGLRLVRLPVRDGQAPAPEQVARFLDVVARSDGPVFVHCGAGVGRTGSMVAAYLVGGGHAGAAAATRAALAVGPPSLEQIAFMAALRGERVRRPHPALVALSRAADAPRRARARLRARPAVVPRAPG
ncbi:fused DSP-PTPase phosphatase/NAD kinase-like protein [Actinomadura flavalba]|uniref:fused DSP-PTPase phosphatase/NAD kinase-like protein n=1 Tax=Actinomadura flavalba TaxID=1120938 RepID=UPI000376E0D9|nr:dual specificity protein phosphatase family protein [Actinomadura flavalba]